MAFSIRAYSAGAWYSLTDRQPYRWLDDDGLGMPPSHAISERGPQQHGATRLAYRLDPRILQAVIGFEASSLSQYWTKRSQLIGSIFAPADDPVILEFTLDNGDIRRLDVFYAGDAGMGYQDRAHLWQRMGIALEAPDPTFYDPAAQAVNFSLDDADAWAIPWPMPWAISSPDINQTTIITYPGTWNSLPILRIWGPITYATITNSITSVADGSLITETLTFPAAIGDGDFYTIDCRYGQKTVVDAAGANQISKLLSYSDLSTFAIRRAREASGGINTIKVTGSGVTAATLLQVSYYNRYLGI